MSIIASESPAIGFAEPVDTDTLNRAGRGFHLVEIMLVAEAILVILLREIDPRNPGAVPIAILLRIALLANLGVVCSMAAAIAANSVPR